MMLERIEKLTMDWFLMEPALLKVLMSHNVTANNAMECPVRCGKRRIEYNPMLCKDLSDNAFAELMKIECIRILLKHPYERQPDNCSATAITLGSNCVVSDNYNLRFVDLHSPEYYNLASGLHFEYYANEIQKQFPQQQQSEGNNSTDENSESNDNGKNGDSDSESKGKSENTDSDSKGKSENSVSNNIDNSSTEAQSALWEENPMAEAEVNELIQVLEATQQWGSLSNDLMGRIIASTKVKIDYRRVMQSFRADILSSKRRLTRMRPNRRSGFQNFGSVYRLTSRLLVAIDVSGSTTDEMVSDFFGIVNKFFKYGIEEIDVIQFDAEVKGEPMPLKKAKKDGIDIVGRGGTDFQPVVDFAAEKKNYYQGLIILTDGYADEPSLPSFFNMPILWVVPSEQEYQCHKKWMKKFGKVCFIEK